MPGMTCGARSLAVIYLPTYACTYARTYERTYAHAYARTYARTYIYLCFNRYTTFGIPFYPCRRLDSVTCSDAHLLES